MKNRRNVLIACMAVAMGLCINMFVFAGGPETKLRVRLTSTAADPLASGSAKFEMRPDRIRFSTECEDVASASNIRVVAGGNDMGTLPIVAGFADLNLDSRDGDTVPVLSVGDLIEVFNTNGNVLILSGNLQPD